MHWIRGRTELWGFTLRREDGKIVTGSGGYYSQEETGEAVAWVRANAGRVEMLEDKGRPRRPPANRRRPRLPTPRRWFFVLYDDSGKVALMSRPCESEQEAEETMLWVKAVAGHAVVHIKNRPTPEYEAWRRRPRQLP